MPALYPHQLEAVDKMHNGCILCGGVGTGKSRTALAYYYIHVCGGKCRINGEGRWEAMASPRPLFIITTAKKRDSLEWVKECIDFHIHDVTVDSWNNIKKYKKVYGAFFIFDEQRVIGYGAWTKTFLNIARKNKWVLLSATPGDTWSDYIPVFIANGFYRNKTEFLFEHAVFNRFSKYPKIEKYVNIGRLIRQRNAILVNMPFVRSTISHKIYVPVEYNKELYKTVWVKRWNPYENQPIEEAGQLCYLLRKVVNSDMSRIDKVNELLEKHRKLIIFYNFDFELTALRRWVATRCAEVGEWNGKCHTDVPTIEPWVYLVQYSAGAEGWNCITTDTIIFFSQNYSYRMTIQAAGRIDRLNTPYTDLYYYHLRSTSPIDMAIMRALSTKKNFNEKAFLGK